MFGRGVDASQLVRSSKLVSRLTGYPVQFQWTLLDGVNDGDDEVDGIAALLAGRHAMMNLIPYNAVEGLRGVAVFAGIGCSCGPLSLLN